jgi:hypothetical protein
MSNFMRYLLQYVLDEKIVLGFLSLIFAVFTIILIKWNCEKEYVMLFGSFISMLVGALLRGITHEKPTNGGNVNG